MNILVMTTGAWDDRNAANTFSNLLEGFEEAEISNIYMRDAPPHNSVCRHYFRITDKMLVKYFLRPSRIGVHIVGTAEARAKDDGAEQNLISFVHRYRLNFAYMLENILWQLGGWRNRRLDRFLNERKPDILFAFAIPSVPRYLLQTYIQEKTGAKTVLFLTDHVCHRYFSSNGRRGKREAERMSAMLSNAARVYAISEELRDIYAKEFGIPITVLRKGCSCVEGRIRRPIPSLPVRMVYAGNLLYGRSKVLAIIAETVRHINRDAPRLVLDIYSDTPLSPKQHECLNRKGTVSLHPARPYEEIRDVLQTADIVLHVESFDPSDMETVKYSFSTKITDALESGSAFLTVGPAGISSVEYVRRLPGTMVVDDLASLEDVLREIVKDPQRLPYLAECTQNYARLHHSVQTVREELKKDFLSLCDGHADPQILP